MEINLCLYVITVRLHPLSCTISVSKTDIHEENNRKRILSLQSGPRIRTMTLLLQDLPGPERNEGKEITYG